MYKTTTLPRRYQFRLQIVPLNYHFPTFFSSIKTTYLKAIFDLGDVHCRFSVHTHTHTPFQKLKYGALLNYKLVHVMCSSRKNPYSPHGGSLEIPRGRGALKAKFLEAMYENKLVRNFLGGRGMQNKILPWGEYGYFLELHITCTSLIDDHLTSQYPLLTW